MAKAVNPIILIVEDDEVLLRALYLFFHNRGYTVASANEGETGLKMAERLIPNVILLDLIMPKMDGFEFIKKAKAQTTLEKVPIIVLSNLGHEDEIDKAKALGVQDYFIKANTDLSTLEEKIRKNYIK